MAPVIEPKKEEKKPETAPVKPRPGLTFDNDEDDEAAIKKKRTFIKLDDAGEVDESLTEAERAAQRNARLLGIRKQIPKEKRRLWSTRIEWAAINEVSRIGVKKLRCSCNRIWSTPRSGHSCRTR
jgi:RNA-binding protein 25